MTRAEMAECAGTAAALLNFSGQKNDLVVGLEAADAELCKTCAGCRNFERENSLCSFYAECHFDRRAVVAVPFNGTGYCHNWHAKEATNGR